MKKRIFVAAGSACLMLLASAALAQEGGLLSDPEQEAMTDTVQHSLEYDKTNQASEWVNPDTGRSGAVTPMRTYQNAEGQPCREFTTTIIIGGEEEQGYGTACRQPDGSWELVSDEGTTPPPAPAQPVPAAPAQEVYPYPPPAAYYLYPDDFFGPARIYLSFSYVYRSGHVYHGRRYLDGRDFRKRHPLVVRKKVFVGPRVYDHYRWPGSWDRRQRLEQREREGRRNRDGRWDRNDRRDWGGDRDHDWGRRWPDPDHDRDRNRDRGRDRDRDRDHGGRGRD